MWVLGSSGSVGSYFPDPNSTIHPNQLINWTLGVYNHMNSLEYVVVQVKLLNSTISGPDQIAGTPSSVPEIFEFSRILLSNETWSIPFVWRLLNLTKQGENLLITGLSIGQSFLTGKLASAAGGIDFRLIFELWIYDENSNTLSFAWSSGGASHSVWTQIWFNATAT